MKIKTKQQCGERSPPTVSLKLILTNKYNYMKKTFLLIIVTILSLNLYSQLDKKTWIVGGSLSYSRAKYNTGVFNSKQEKYELMITPTIGYFFIDKLAAGIITTVYESGDRDQGASSWNKYSNLNFGPFVRYYFFNKEKLVNLIAQGYYQFGSEGVTSGIAKTTLAFSAGPVIYFNSSIGLEFLINQLTYRYRNVDASDNKIQFSLGFLVHLQKDK
jgi:hypothetical protein